MFVVVLLSCHGHLLHFSPPALHLGHLLLILLHDLRVVLQKFYQLLLLLGLLLEIGWVFRERVHVFKIIVYGEVI